jgi:hypothetical protein
LRLQLLGIAPAVVAIAEGYVSTSGSGYRATVVGSPAYIFGRGYEPDFIGIPLGIFATNSECSIVAAILSEDYLHTEVAPLRQNSIERSGQVWLVIEGGNYNGNKR